MERETRFELATSTLARLHSTTELFPLIEQLKRADIYHKPTGRVNKKNAPNNFS